MKHHIPEEPMEKLAVSVRLATSSPEDLEAFKELRHLALTGKDSEMFGMSSHPEQVEEERNRTDLELSENKFIVLSFESSRAIGIGIARKREKEDDWWMGAGYIREDCRGRGIGKKMFAKRLQEIINRGGRKVTLAVKAVNAKSIHIAESFGFKKVDEGASDEGFYMQLENVNNPEVVKKINEVLNAG